MSIPEGVLAEGVQEDAEWLAANLARFYRAKARVTQWMLDDDCQSILTPDGTLCLVERQSHGQPTLGFYWRIEIK